ncbi:MAG TPA: hypothetical protein VK889_00765 [Solirubrobacterales bacterium]|nr:hypothetical protein [Solirubrobacterales bacterium]
MLERAAQAFRADMWDSACEDALYECGIAERRFGPVQVNVIEALPESFALNTVLGAAEPGAVRGGHLEQAIEWADAFGVDYRVMVGKQRPETAAAEAWLDRHGFEQGSGWMRYARNGMAPPDLPGVPGVKVWEIGEPGDEDLAGETMVFSAAAALGMPSVASTLLCELPAQKRWHCFTAELEEEIVAYGSMLIRDGVAALGLETTIPAARRRGCNQALLRERILTAYESGCEVIFAGVPTYGSDLAGPAARNLIRAGFVPAHLSVNWQRPRSW